MVHVEHTRRHRTHPKIIAARRPPIAQLQYDDHGDTVIEIGKILSHKVRRRSYYFLALPKNAPTHEASWQPLADFIDEDGTITEALHSYLVQHNRLPYLH